MLFTEDSDSEVFERTSTASVGADPHLFARTNSSSSSRKSSYEEGTENRTPLLMADPSTTDSTGQMLMEVGPGNALSVASAAPPTIVEWKPQGEAKDDGLLERRQQNGYKELGSEGVVSSPGGQGARQGEEGDLEALYGSTVTVTIDPPRDDDVGGGADDIVARYLDGKEEGVMTRGVRSLAELFDSEGAEEEELDLFRNMEKVDLLEEEDLDTPSPTKICLLSKYVC